MLRSATTPLVTALVCLLVCTAAAQAGDKNLNGKELYKQNCRVCHDKNSVHGEYSPLTLIQDQWKTFFKDKLAPAHKGVSLPGKSEKLLEELSPEQLKAIQKFCVDHAADSEQPQTCS